ncbi:MAG: adenylyl-sulfate kinase [Caldilineaceae bacterium]
MADRAAVGREEHARPRRGAQLADCDIHVQILDSDELRTRLIRQPTYSADERDWFYDLVVFLAELLTRNGVNVIAATGHRRVYRDAARRDIRRFAEVYVACPVEVCRRDPRGCGPRPTGARSTGCPADEAYEPPLTPDVVVDSAMLAPDGAAAWSSRD